MTTGRLQTFARACIRADGGDQCIEEREGVSHQHRYYRGRPISVCFVSDGRRSGLHTLSSWEGGEENSFCKQCSGALVVSFTEVILILIF